MRLYKDGIEKQVIIDDQFPFTLAFQPAFSSTSNHTEFWLMALEKGKKTLFI